MRNAMKLYLVSDSEDIWSETMKKRKQQPTTVWQDSHKKQKEVFPFLITVDKIITLLFIKNDFFVSLCK